MYKYTVTFEEGSENGLVHINLGQDGYSEFDHIDGQGREVYIVYSKYDIDIQLDQRSQVVSYIVEKM